MSQISQTFWEEKARRIVKILIKLSVLNLLPTSALNYCTYCTVHTFLCKEGLLSTFALTLTPKVSCSDSCYRDVNVFPHLNSYFVKYILMTKIIRTL